LALLISENKGRNWEPFKILPQFKPFKELRGNLDPKYMKFKFGEIKRRLGKKHPRGIKKLGNPALLEEISVP